MILIIAEPGDGAALWLHRAMAAATRTAVRVVTPAQLAYATSAAHRLSTDADSVTFILADGTTLRGADLVGCINRLVALPQAHLARASAEDRLYAAGELQAFTLGWLATLPCPMLNAPAPESLAGPWHGELAARQFAVLAGFDCAPVALSLDDELGPIFRDSGIQAHVVLAGEVVGPPLSDEAHAAMLQFALLWGGAMVEIATWTRGGRRHFAGATGMIDFPGAGAPLVAAMLRALAA